MGKEILMFGDIEIEKSKFYCHKSPIFLKDLQDFFWEKEQSIFY